MESYLTFSDHAYKGSWIMAKDYCDWWNMPALSAWFWSWIAFQRLLFALLECSDYTAHTITTGMYTALYDWPATIPFVLAAWTAFSCKFTADGALWRLSNEAVQHIQVVRVSQTVHTREQMSSDRFRHKCPDSSQTDCRHRHTDSRIQAYTQFSFSLLFV